MTGVLDTNVVLYLLGGRLAEPLPSGTFAVSVITEMELLSYPALAPAEESAVRQFLASVVLVDLSPPIRTAAIALRRQHRLRIPDAIVAATAASLGAELLPNDDSLAKTPGVRARSVLLK